jgi:hypothetical protein
MSRPHADRLNAYLEAQVAAAGDDRASRCRAVCVAVTAAIQQSEAARKLRVDRLLCQVDELARGAEPFTAPPLARAFVDLLEAQDGPCDRAPPGSCARPAPGTCQCSVCMASRAFRDRFDTQIPLESLLEQLVFLGYEGTGTNLPPAHYIERIFEILDGEFETLDAVERVSEAALAQLTGTGGGKP